MRDENFFVSFSTGFFSICAYDNRILPEYFTLDIKILPKSDDSRILDILRSRIEVFVSEIINNSIFIKHDDEFSQIMYVTHNKVVELWDDPNPHLIAKALFNKLNAIVDEHGLIDTVEITSTSMSGYRVSYCGFDENYDNVIELDDPEYWEAYLKGTGQTLPWWERNDTTTSNHVIPNDEDTGVMIDDMNLTWEDCGLEWDSDEDDPVLTPDKKKSSFVPKIIPGGKDDK